MALILIVDDEYFLAKMLADILEDEGYEVEMASNGKVALKAARDKKPALIITDFMMPAMTGLELAEAVRADRGISDTPIILVSGAQGAIARKRPELFHAVFDKPYSNYDMLDEISKAIKSKEL